MRTPREILLRRHKAVEPRLGRMWSEALAPILTKEGDAVRPNVLIAIGWKMWRELILPSRRIWAGLACAWVAIAVVNLASSKAPTKVVIQTKPPSHEEMRALTEQRRMLAQLIGPPSEPANAHKRTSPGPRSERTVQISTA